MVSYLVQEDDGVWVQKNDHWSFWGKRDKGHQDNNYIFHFSSLGVIVKHYKQMLSEQGGIKRIITVSDQCAEQYKSKYFINLMMRFCDEYDLDEFIAAFYATHQGKGQVDGLGNGVRVGW